jgi:hypothetical protein
MRLPSDWGQAAVTSSVAGATAWNNWPKLDQSLPLKTAQRTWSRSDFAPLQRLP